MYLFLELLNQLVDFEWVVYSRAVTNSLNLGILKDESALAFFPECFLFHWVLCVLHWFADPNMGCYVGEYICPPWRGPVDKPLPLECFSTLASHGND